jgi:hypothetical protein
MNRGVLMAQFACTELKKRKILAAMFLTNFIGLPGTARSIHLCIRNKDCTDVTAVSS